MGQVPQNTILLIGNGKMTKHLGYYFTSLGYKISTWHYKLNESNQLENLYKNCLRCFILIRDDSLQNFVKQYDFLKFGKSIHCSGSLTIDGVKCIHPLMTFSNNLYEIDFYKKIHWALFEENKRLDDYLPGLSNPYFFVKPEQKTLYHAMCVMSGNFTQLLLHQVLLQWQMNLKLTKESLKPYLYMVLENFWKNEAGALTGPLARKDFGTINAHLNSLQDNELIHLYQSFLKLHLTEQEMRQIK